MNGVSGSATRPRLSRETRRLLMAVLASLIALWTLARLRFPETSATPNPIQPILTQLSPTLGFAELEAQINRAQSRLLPALLPVMIGAADAPAAARTRYASLRLGNEIAVTLLEPGVIPALEGLVAFDRGTGLAIVRAPEAVRPVLPLPATTGSFESARYLLAAQATGAGLWLQPVVLGPLSRQPHAGWSGEVWALPESADLPTTALLFTHDGDLAGGLARDAGGATIVPGDVLISDALRLASRDRTPALDLGIEVQPLTVALEAAARANGGVMVTAVDPRVPAAQLRIGDVIEALGEVPITSVRDWHVHAGRVVEPRMSLRVRRDGQTTTVVLAPPPDGVDSDNDPRELGLTLRTVARTGAEVVKVERSSAAARAGIRPGDLIVAVGAIRAPGPAQVVQAYTTAVPESPLLLGLARGNSHLVVALVK